MTESADRTATDSAAPAGPAASAAPRAPRPRGRRRAGAGRGRLHQPWRIVVAVVELVVAAVAVWGAFPLWGSAIREVTVRLDDGSALTSRVYEGDRIALAVALGALAAVLVIDAVRQVMLGVAAKGKKPKKRKQPDPDADVPDPDRPEGDRDGAESGGAGRAARARD
ncbi:MULTISPECIES: hypothetical protein [Prauserella salsuginis group]|uniref:Uncharacterized protein n=2 Tax=Prauserella salsuginis group TaxID=2893672 RepID=A0A839XG80_9PSEU|nr:MULTISPECIES: hypothetical protein [Prauserella salsuginis group]MBB3662290.1 hypothetical protein [Prauserella sediminis]MCR3720003.1 hypothetical protein [Prauserella flava]MCR3736453.1 hypothetical protein [Prauserella salsuginis]